ncbi:MAG: hypothetical protein ACJAYU_005382 [Bradymonadia bacterium]|jgi:hypothetical protein
MATSLRFSSLAALVVGATAFSGCAEFPERSDSSATSHNLALTFDTLADTDVGGFQFTVTEVDCATGIPIVPANIVVASEDLEDMYLPGDGTIFEDAPYDGDSQHLFSDHFFWLPQGCFDVLVQPVTADGTLSEDCASAHMTNVAVVDGATTEIVLISQCEGDPGGGLDVVATLNHPPQIVGMTYDPSKFICEGTTTVCLDVWDPDNDPLSARPRLPLGVTVVSESQETNDEGVTTFCYELSFSSPGDYTLGLLINDMGYDEDGNLVTIESLLAAQGDPAVSSDYLSFPVHVLSEDDCISTCECAEGFELTPAGDECIRTDEAEVTWTGTEYTVCEGDELSQYGMWGARFPAGLDAVTAFFQSRLNGVGVWACGEGTSTAGTNPVNEWIGFTVCLDIDEPGDYMIGMAADNRLRFRVNGAPFFTRNTSLIQNFRRWWMNPVPLNSGLNIIEMEGRNDGSWAAFGAEVYGPFAAGSLANDTDMAAADSEGNVLWSTQEMLGLPFITGESSGYSCPDGYAMNTCSGEITCTRIERRPCE